MSFETILILSAICDFIVLICFFVLCSNVSALKGKFVSKHPKTAQFTFYMSVGDKEKAREVLYQMILEEGEFNTLFFSFKDRRDAWFPDFERKYKSYFDALGIELNREFVDKFLENKV